MYGEVYFFVATRLVFTFDKHIKEASAGKQIVAHPCASSLILADGHEKCLVMR